MEFSSPPYQFSLILIMVIYEFNVRVNETIKTGFYFYFEEKQEPFRWKNLFRSQVHGFIFCDKLLNHPFEKGDLIRISINTLKDGLFKLNGKITDLDDNSLIFDMPDTSTGQLFCKKINEKFFKEGDIIMITISLLEDIDEK